MGNESAGDPPFEGVRRSTAYVLLLDSAAHLALLVWALTGLSGTPGPGALASWGSAVAAGYAVVALWANAGCFARNGNANVWRRRLAFVPLLAALWRAGPFFVLWVQLPVVLWGGCLWLVLLAESARDARGAPGE